VLVTALIRVRGAVERGGAAWVVVPTTPRAHCSCTSTRFCHPSLFPPMGDTPPQEADAPAAPAASAAPAAPAAADGDGPPAAKVVTVYASSSSGVAESYKRLAYEVGEVRRP